MKELEKDFTGSNKVKLLKKWRPIDHIIDRYFFQNEKGGRVKVINFISRLFLLVFLKIFPSFFP